METVYRLRHICHTQQFKSYYVVWKRKSDRLVKYECICLNRTMQYGNPKVCDRWKPCRKGLNRTMQYGNNQKSKKQQRKRKRLNRTMQYGNDIYIISFFGRPRLFKSYYVVWKQKFKQENKDFLLRLNRTMQYGNKKIDENKKMRKEV